MDDQQERETVEQLDEDVQSDRVDETDLNSIDRSVKTWHIFGARIPRSEVVFLSQVVVMYGVIVSCICNLSLHNENTELWVALLSSCLGYLLPTPQITDGR